MVGEDGRAGGGGGEGGGSIGVFVVNRDLGGALGNCRLPVPPYDLSMSSRRHKQQIQPSHESPPRASLPHEAHRRRSPKVPDTLAMSSRRKVHMSEVEVGRCSSRQMRASHAMGVPMDVVLAHRLMQHLRPQARPVSSGQHPPPVRSGGTHSPRPEKAPSFSMIGVKMYETAVSASHSGPDETAGQHALLGQGTSTTCARMT